jgi:hypothetical protein
MPLSLVASVIFATDAFWTKMNVEGLGALLSTCHEFRNELTWNESNKEKKKGSPPPPLFIKALNIIMANVHHQYNRELSVKEAMLRFSLTMPCIVKFCKNLPGDNPYHLSGNFHDFKNRYRILFTDAMTIAMERKGGLKTVAKLKVKAATTNDKRIEKMAKDSGEYVENVEATLARMLEGIDKAIDILKNEQNKDYRGRITIIKSIRYEVERVQSRADWLRYVLNSPRSKSNICSIKEATKALKHHKDVLARRYTSHSRLNSFAI